MYLILDLFIISTILLYSTTNGYEGGFREVALLKHNEYRTKLNLTPLKLADILNRVAHAHAEKLGRELKFEKSGTGGFSDKENLWAYYGELRPLYRSTQEAVDSWYNYPKYFLSSVNQQVLLSNETALVGIGCGTNDIGYTVVVANYL